MPYRMNPCDRLPAPTEESDRALRGLPVGERVLGIRLPAAHAEGPRGHGAQGPPPHPHRQVHAVGSTSDAMTRKSNTRLRIERRHRQNAWAAQRRARGICRDCENRSDRFAYCLDCRLRRTGVTR